MRDLLKECGAIFVYTDVGSVNVVKSSLSEVFGYGNFISQIHVRRVCCKTSQYLSDACDYILFSAKNRQQLKYHPLLRLEGFVDAAEARSDFVERNSGRELFPSEEKTAGTAEPLCVQRYRAVDLITDAPPGRFQVAHRGKRYSPGEKYWTIDASQFSRLLRANRIVESEFTLKYKQFPGEILDGASIVDNLWTDLDARVRASERKLGVISPSCVAERCILMASDPGDLVLDPSCGAGTTIYAAERTGRRWIGADTSRVALEFTRALLKSAQFPVYLAARQEAPHINKQLVCGNGPELSEMGRCRPQEFVYDRLLKISPQSIGRNGDIDLICDRWDPLLDALRKQLNTLLKTQWEPWEVPASADPLWPPEVLRLHTEWKRSRVQNQREVDASIAARARCSYVRERLREDKSKARVSGRFTVESLLTQVPSRCTPPEPAISVQIESRGELRVVMGDGPSFHLNGPGVPTADLSQIDCWFLDTDYNGSEFFADHVYLGTAENAPKELRSTLRARECGELRSENAGTVSESFDRPASGMIGVRVVNSLGTVTTHLLKV